MLDRRTLLRQAGVASAVGLLGRWPGARPWTGAPNELFPEPDAAALRALALVAIDAARAAGAAFADVRVTVTRTASTVAQYAKEPGAAGEPPRAYPSVGLYTGYGIRAIVDGSWGFASGTELTTENVARLAQAAVHAARANRRLHPRALELAPVPANVTGMWSTPIERDPFSVSLVEQGQLILESLKRAVALPEVIEVQLGFDWRGAVSIFAATDGRVFTQRLMMGQPAGGVTAAVGREPLDRASSSFDAFQLGGYGYEAVREATLGEDVRGVAERAVALARAARTATSVDVGRADLVLSAGAVAGLLNQTLLPALDLPRALGYVADVGTSFAAPPAAMLGRFQVASQLLTIRADRTRPHGSASVKWDDEGVETEAYTVVENGTIVDYHTNRETAVALADWYARRGEPMRSHGCARRAGDLVPTAVTPNVTVMPGPSATKVEDLIAGTTRGFYVEGTAGDSDQQFVTGQFAAEHYLVREIRRGKLGGYVKDAAFQFTTVPFWKSIDGIGGRDSLRRVGATTDFVEQFAPLQVFPSSTYETVPMRARQVNVINTGRIA